MGASRSKIPSSAMAIAVMAMTTLLMEAMRILVSGVISRSFFTAQPQAPAWLSWPFSTVATVTPAALYRSITWARAWSTSSWVRMGPGSGSGSGAITGRASML